jgi:hypothetical protein
VRGGGAACGGFGRPLGCIETYDGVTFMLGLIANYWKSLGAYVCIYSYYVVCSGCLSDTSRLFIALSVNVLGVYVNIGLSFPATLSIILCGNKLS